MRPILILTFCVWCVIAITCNANEYEEEKEGFVVRRENRRVLVSTENGEIVGARVGSSYLVHFFTMDPNSLFLPVILHSDMVFYVHTGSGKLFWTEESELKRADLRSGDVYRLKAGAVFFIESNLETDTQRRKLRIHSIFSNSNIDIHEPPSEPYSSIRDMVLGFDKKVLQAAFKVCDEAIEELLSGMKPPAIIHGVSKSEKRAREMEQKFLGSILGSDIFGLSKKMGKSSTKLFNLFKEDKDFQNRNGWSTTVTGKRLSALKGTNIGLFMVNLTAGSMMGPHWNPVATEVAVVVEGRGMVRVVCPSVLNGTGCSEMRFEVEEGDIFSVPRFYPMAQMAFNNETFVFMGFSSSAKKNHPQFLAGQASVLRTLSKDVLATSFNVGNMTMDQLLDSQQESVILGCVSCAEEELRILEEEREKEREREEEERKREEEEAREREEEEAREKEEERRRKEEEEREREEEEAKRQEEERKRREEEEEEAARREEEERRRREEEEEAKKQEEERKRREKEEEEAAARREEEERKRREEEEEAKRQEEERKRREEEEEEAARREEEERERREEEEEARRQEEERKRREEEEEEAAARREEEERKRREEEEEAKRQEEERQREEEEEMARREEEERQRREEEEEERRRQRAAAKREQEERRREEEAEIARREEEERQRRQEEEEEERGRERKQRRREEEEEHEHEKQWSEEEEAAEEEERRREEDERREEERRREKEE
ncbi:vicilin-like seed storage protein At2g18540 [Salvia hispanica]|uniref:vicilin-like seed storage protein At2g18540 n=1 Tax=Salvia hispanica TaxID=49212 RepID=UPI0020096465|nr:vicilin-like seed storage protein At2g18540 [Salvia hispanica]